MFVTPPTTQASIAVFDKSKLIDHGVAHELYYFALVNVIVLMSVSNSFGDYDQLVREFNTLQARSQRKGIEFLMIDPSVDGRRRFLSDRSARSPIVVDETQMISSSLGIAHTDEVLVSRPSHGEPSGVGIL